MGLKVVVLISTVMASVIASATEAMPWVGSGAFTVFALTGFGLMWKSWRSELNRLAWNLRKKDAQNAVLLNAILRAGVQIPERYFHIEQATKEEDL